MKRLFFHFSSGFRHGLYLQRFPEEQCPVELYQREHPQVAWIRDLFRLLFLKQDSREDFYLLPALELFPHISYSKYSPQNSSIIVNLVCKLTDISKCASHMCVLLSVDFRIIKGVVSCQGLEPWTHALKGRCSTD